MITLSVHEPKKSTDNYTLLSLANIRKEQTPPLVVVLAGTSTDTATGPSVTSKILQIPVLI